MKKNGFTMVEVLIALTIVATVAAVTAPLISNIIPDRDKVLVLKAYKTLLDINDDLLSDKSLYLQNGCVGLECTQLPSNPDFQDNNRFSGNVKYRNLLMTKMKNTIEPNGQNFPDNAFSTQDGIIWIVDDNTRDVIIDFDKNNSDADSCTFEDEGCDKVDRFIFNVTSRGNVVGGDALTRAYLANPDKLNDKKHDYSVANEELNPEEDEEE